MPNIGVVLKQEILRLAAKQVRRAVAPLRAEKISLKKLTRELRMRVRELEGDVQLLKSEQGRSRKLVIGALPAKDLSIRVTAKGIRSLRRRLGLSQAEFARLLSVSVPTVWQWEKRTGALKVRDTTKKAIFAVRDMGAREARRMLDDMPKPEAKVPIRRKSRK